MPLGVGPNCPGGPRRGATQLKSLVVGPGPVQPLGRRAVVGADAALMQRRGKGKGKGSLARPAGGGRRCKICGRWKGRARRRMRAGAGGGEVRRAGGRPAGRLARVLSCLCLPTRRGAVESEDRGNPRRGNYDDSMILTGDDDQSTIDGPFKSNLESEGLPKQHASRQQRCIFEGGGAHRPTNTAPPDSRAYTRCCGAAAHGAWKGHLVVVGGPVLSSWSAPRPRAWPGAARPPH